MTTRAATLFTMLALLVGGAVLAHATAVIGTLSTTPDIPQAGEPFVLRLELTDQTDLPVEDAYVLAEFRPQDASEEVEPVSSVEFAETGDAGVYETTLTLPEPGTYSLLLRDQTFRQEEARARTLFNVGSETPADALTIIFPPTATPASTYTWMYWVVGLPLLAAIVVTVIVLRSPPAEAKA